MEMSRCIRNLGSEMIQRRVDSIFLHEVNNLETSEGKNSLLDIGTKGKEN